MNLAIIGTGKVGGALATKLASAGHTIFLGVQDVENFKGKELLNNLNTKVFPVEVAVKKSEVIIIATPAMAAVEVAKSLGDTSGKIIIDAMNIVRGNGPSDFTNTAAAILANTQTQDVVKCFNTTGFENMLNPIYKGEGIDMFVAGNSEKGKRVAAQLAKDIGFGTVHDLGGNEQFFLIEQLANVWINQAIFRNAGRDIALKFIRR